MTDFKGMKDWATWISTLNQAQIPFYLHFEWKMNEHRTPSSSLHCTVYTCKLQKTKSRKFAIKTNCKSVLFVRVRTHERPAATTSLSGHQWLHKFADDAVCAVKAVMVGWALNPPPKKTQQKQTLTHLESTLCSWCSPIMKARSLLWTARDRCVETSEWLQCHVTDERDVIGGEPRSAGMERASRVSYVFISIFKHRPFFLN